MVFDYVLAGPADALRAALRMLTAPSIGLAVIGDGAVDQARVIARAPTWRDLDPATIPHAPLVLAEAPSQEDLRIIVRGMANQRALRVIEAGAARALRVDDLVGRPSAQADWTRIAAVLRGRRVLVTGGGGSIGAALARKVATLSPSRLTVLDNSEFNLFQMGMDASGASLALADIRDAGALRRWMEQERPDIVFHAAALKHVPMAESFPCEAVVTNVCGLRNVADAARAVAADLIFVSTDKAVDPTGVMGATKRLGELYVGALDLCGGPRAIAVRLGNVVGSAGSVVPLFEAQIAARKPLTVTDPNATRFFMSISNAAAALLQSAAAGLAQSDARGLVMAIDMGEPLSVMELAEDMIRLAELRPHQDVEIRVTGLRPGERLHEFFVGAEEWRGPSPAEGVISIAAPPRGLADLQEAMERLALLARAGDDAQVRAELFAAVAPLRQDRAVAALSPVCA